MTRLDFRFRPPEVASSVELAWVLDHAFGPASSRLAPPQAEDALDLARRLGLASRIAHRERGQRARRPVDDALHEVRATAAVRELLFEEALTDLDAGARRTGLEVALLKGRALTLCGVARSGSRPSSDIDVLVPAPSVGDLQRELVGLGFTLSASRPEDHHPPPVVHASGVSVELHTHLPGVRIAGDRSATWTHFEDRNELLAAPRADRWPAVRVPSRHVMTAHAVVHALAQHGLTGGYPGWLLVADLLDLEAARPVDPPDLPEWFAWIASEVSPSEAAAALSLADAVRQGLDPITDLGDGRPHQLARHFVANALDDDYRLALKARWLEAPVTDGPLIWRRIRLLARTFVPPAVASGPGPPPGALVRVLRWIARPFDLVGRWLRARAARKRSR